MSAKADFQKLIKSKLGWGLVTQPPLYLEKYKWLPHHIFWISSVNRYVAVDVIYNEQWSNKIYGKEVPRVIRENRTLEVCLFTPYSSTFEHLQDLCKKRGYGLKVFTPTSITTILPLSFESPPTFRKTIAGPTGWFPEAILKNVNNLKRLKFKKELKNLAQKLKEDMTDSGQLNNIKEALDDMLKAVPYVPADSLPFMRLSHFENLLDCTDIKHRDHVFHSARVFLVGCSIIDRFYDKFVSYYHKILAETNVNIEYMWLLAALFHDIGRIKQDTWKIYLVDPKEDGEGLKAQICEQMCKQWKKPEYKNALFNLVELINQSEANEEKRNIPWTGYALGGPVDEDLQNIFVESYNTMGSHGVISCFEFTSDILEKLAALRSENKTFPLYHVFPAMLAVAFHDYNIWSALRQKRIFPISMRDYPLAALLIYIDTWDDYKRTKEREVSIDEILFKDNEVTVQVTWANKKAYVNDKIKYDSFRENVTFDDICLRIIVSNEINP